MRTARDSAGKGWRLAARRVKSDRTAQEEGHPISAVGEKPGDVSTAVGKAFLDILGVFAVIKANLHCEPQTEGQSPDREGRRVEDLT